MKKIILILILFVFLTACASDDYQVLPYESYEPEEVEEIAPAAFSPRGRWVFVESQEVVDDFITPLIDIRRRDIIVAFYGMLYGRLVRTSNYDFTITEISGNSRGVNWHADDGLEAWLSFNPETELLRYTMFNESDERYMHFYFERFPEGADNWETMDNLFETVDVERFMIGSVNAGTAEIIFTGEFFTREQMETMKAQAASWQASPAGIANFAHIIVIEPVNGGEQQVFLTENNLTPSHRREEYVTYERIRITTPVRGAEIRLIQVGMGGGSGELSLTYMFTTRNSVWLESFYSEAKRFTDEGWTYEEGVCGWGNDTLHQIGESWSEAQNRTFIASTLQNAQFR
ncbi:MAG: hypothetical protein FWE04_03070 [Oscillospiraceae bacterium]|nr:hypothetical protein [Oscillospiraceae bacterium]